LAFEAGASDVTMQTNQPIWVFLKRQQVVMTPSRPLMQAEINDVLTHLYGSANGPVKVSGGEDLDFSFQLRLSRTARARFRVNAVGVNSDGARGFQITMRTIADTPPLPHEVGIPDDLVRMFLQRDGVGIVAGPTGSGKSTTLAAMLRSKVEDPNGHSKVITFEAPIEYTFDKVPAATSYVAQTEIPRDLPSFGRGIRNAMRRAPQIILVGETRDLETAGSLIEAATTGHLVLTTLHTTGVAETIDRLVAIFPAGERDGRSMALLHVLRVIMNQALVRKVDGNLMALREYLVFDDVVKSALYGLPPAEWGVCIRRMVQDRGMTMLQAAERAFDAGEIAQETLTEFAHRTGSRYVGGSHGRLGMTPTGFAPASGE
jgi:defect-in-organelle-trafficking protein DotB